MQINIEARSGEYQIRSRKQTMSIYEIAGKRPVIAADAFIHPDATVIGEVTIGNLCFIGPGVVIRADCGPISIGNGSNIQDNAVIHVDTNSRVIIEDNVLIAHSAVLHDVHIHPFSIIGMGAILLQNVICEEQVLVAAGSVVTPGTRIPANKMAAGNPAKIIKDVSADFLSQVRSGIDVYKKLAMQYRESLVKIV